MPRYQRPVTDRQGADCRLPKKKNQYDYGMDRLVDTPCANIKIKRGINQGDALPPLLFCVAINPLRYILRDAKQGYALKTGHKINHLYLDDLKL